MDDISTEEIWKDNDGQRREKPQKRRLNRKVLLLVLILVLVLGVVLVAAYRDGTGFDVLRRYLNYGSVETAGGEAVYDYDASTNNRFAVLGDHLAVLSDSSLEILNKNGEEAWKAPVKMSSPALLYGGNKVAAYDVGGHSLYVLDERGKHKTLETPPEEPLIAVTMNRQGWLAVTTEAKNRKGVVTVYDEKMEEVFAFNSSRRFVMDAYVTDDCKYLAAVTLGQEGGVFVSNIVIYNLNKKDPVADYSVTDGLVLEIGQQGDQLTTVSDTGLTFAKPNGTVVGTYDYKGQYLREYSLEADGFVPLLLNRYQSGSVGRLVTVASDGTEIASLDINEEVQGLSAQGRYLAVLYLDSLVIYNQELEVYASLQGTGDAKDVLVRADGSALLLSPEEARIFLP